MKFSILNTVYLSCVFFCFLLGSCKSKADSYAKFNPIDLHLTNHSIQPIDSLRNTNIYQWIADAQIINHTNDTLWIERSRSESDNLLVCKVYFLIIQSNKIFRGSQSPHSPISKYLAIFPNDTNHCKVEFFLEKKYTTMDNLYVGISPRYSLSLPPFDSISNNIDTMLHKNIMYSPLYEFYIDVKQGMIQKINLNIDSLIKKNDYQVNDVYFW